MSLPQERKLLKLQLLAPSQIPAHPALESVQSNASADLTSFVSQLLSEGKHFADEVIPKTFKHVKIQRLPRSRGGDVEVLAGGKEVDDPAGNGGRGEYWFARRSTHTLLPDGIQEQGKASWGEFVDALFVDHSVKEGEYTPDVYDSHRVCDWDTELQGKTIDGWENISLQIYEMAHAINFPLQPRVFSTLVLTARDSENSYMDVQIPVDISSVPSAKYSNGKNRTEGTTAQQRKKAVIGRYVSVERCRKVPGESEIVQWDMATASDAAGILPMAVQKMALPGVIAKDVEFVMNWAAKKRASGEPRVASGGSAS
ncbi:uncharacterized protein PV09_06888 [Verruconis gallopava]|uniref:DUF3074 domain-containing protein n=1 Tax=Verruconis gallopava TaxID=253628 RepID=A0A0D1XHK0_9PEZI|nr:uncharacterized protein PV09_06888 [Verruconis gallopava]KIW01711.1 hypothetical protein PV09_06888 [Verruconis gallopava]